MKEFFFPFFVELFQTFNGSEHITYLSTRQLMVILVAVLLIFMAVIGDNTTDLEEFGFEMNPCPLWENKKQKSKNKKGRDGKPPLANGGGHGLPRGPPPLAWGWLGHPFLFFFFLFEFWIFFK
jgi:hypothetical protein